MWWLFYFMKKIMWVESQRLISVSVVLIRLRVFTNIFRDYQQPRPHIKYENQTHILIKITWVCFLSTVQIFIGVPWLKWTIKYKKMS